MKILDRYLAMSILTSTLLVLGVLLPLIMLYSLHQVDPRLRIGSLISEKHKIPLLAVVPHLSAPAETQAVRRELAWLSLMVNGTLLVVLVTAALRVAKVF